MQTEDRKIRWIKVRRVRRQRWKVIAPGGNRRKLMTYKQRYVIAVNREGHVEESQEETKTMLQGVRAASRD